VIRLLKKTHMLRCARPTRSNVPQRVRLRSSIFARLASEIFLSSLTVRVCQHPVSLGSTGLRIFYRKERKGHKVHRFQHSQ
jgi:hypothetical protein